MYLRFWTFLWLMVVGVCAMKAQSPLSAMSTVSVRGRLLQDSSGAGIGFGSVYFTPQSSKIPAYATVADEQGYWNIQNVNPGIYHLEVSCLGYSPFFIERVSVDSFSNFLLLRDFYLKPLPKVLLSVEVVSEKPIAQFGTEKRVYQVDKQFSSLGGTLIDVLNDIPAIQVETNGIIRLRGSEQTVLMINGVPVGSSANIQSSLLQTLNAAAIQMVEVILNPNVSYSAEGNAGIINIVTKKNDQSGFNVSVEANAGSGRNNLAEEWTPRSELNLGMYWRKTKWSAYLMGSTNSKKAWRTVTAERTNTETDSLWNEYIFSLANSHQRNFFFQAGLDYKWSNGLSVHHQYQWMTRNNKIYDETINDFFPNKVFGFRAFRKEDVWENQPVADYTGKLKKVLKGDPHHMFEATFAMTFLNIDELNQLTEVVLGSSGLPRIQQSHKDFRNKYYLGQVIYKNPFKNGIHWELGFSWAHRNDEDRYGVQSVDPVSGEWVINTRQTNHFQYLENVWSGFTALNGKWKKITYQLGYRMEYATVAARQLITDQYFPLRYLKGYPGLNLSYSIRKNSQFQFITSRRISRPSYQLLDPFTDYADSLNIKKGNPALLPELTWNFEIGFQHTADWGGIHSSFFIKETKDYLSRYLEIAPFSRSLIYSYRNIDNSHFWGGEVNANVKVAKWWKVTASASAFHQHFHETETSGLLERKGLGWFTRLQQQWSLPHAIELQYALLYRSNAPMYQGYSFYNWTMDIGLRKQIAKGRGSLTLKCSDPWNTLFYGFYASDPKFSLHRTIKRESRTLIVGFKYALSQEKPHKLEREPKSSDLNSLESY